MKTSRGRRGTGLSKIHFHVKSEYYREIKAGRKLKEYRERTPYWTRILLRPDGSIKDFSAVVIHDAFKGGKMNRLEFPWKGWDSETITHPHFGEEPVSVFSIHLVCECGKPADQVFTERRAVCVECCHRMAMEAPNLPE